MWLNYNYKVILNKFNQNWLFLVINKWFINNYNVKKYYRMIDLFYIINFALIII